MAEYAPVVGWGLKAVLAVLVLVSAACLVRAVLGPRFTDRVVALNMICTAVILLVCVLSCLLGESYLVDVAILYALLNLRAVAVLCRLAITHRRGGGGEKR